jgi:hypothetical protein
MQCKKKKGIQTRKFQNDIREQKKVGKELLFILFYVRLAFLFSLYFLVKNRKKIIVINF